MRKVLLLVATALTTLGTSAQWSAVGAKGFTPGVATAMDLEVHEDTLYAAFQDYSGTNSGKVTVQKFNGSAWETVGQDGFTTNAASYPDLEFNGNDMYLGWRDGFSKATLNKFNGTVWVPEGPQNFGLQGGFHQWEFVKDTMHVAYADNVHGMTVLKYNGTDWDTVGVKGFSDGLVSNIDFEVYNDTMYVAYRDEANINGVTVKKFDGNAWVSVGSQGFTSGALWVDLAIDNGELYVAYRDGGSSNWLTVRKFNGASWPVVGVPGFSSTAVTYVNLEVVNGQPYVAYTEDGNDYKTFVQTFNGSSWTAVGTSTDVSDGQALQAEMTYSNGYLYVGYTDNTKSNKATVLKRDVCLVNIPDPVFKAYLVNTSIDVDDDDEIQCSEAAAFTGGFNLSYSAVKDLTGIEAFPNLSELRLDNTDLDVDTLRLNDNTKIKKLYATNANLTHVEFDTLDALQTLVLTGNTIDTIDLSNSDRAYNITVSNNGVKKLILPTHHFMYFLVASDNPGIDINFSDATYLRKITVKNCGLTNPDFSANGDLQELEISNNPLTNLDVTSNASLQVLRINQTPLQAIDLTSSTGLKTLQANQTQLFTLSTRFCSGIQNVEVLNNDSLQELNLRNGNNAVLTTFDGRSNPKLKCITVDNAFFANAKTGSYANWEKDPRVIYNEDCATACLPTWTDQEVLCSSTSLTIGTHMYDSSGFYIDTLTSVVTGCDSIIHTYFSMFDPKNVNVVVDESTLCPGGDAVISAVDSDSTQFYLLENSNGETVVGPVKGTGDSLHFELSGVDSSETYSVKAVNSYFNQAMEFDGVDDRLLTNKKFPGADEMTVEAWVKPAPGANDQNIFVASQIGNAHIYNGQFLFDTYLYGTSLRMVVSTTGTQTNQSLIAYQVLTLGEWNHVAASYGDEGKFKMYVNGDLVQQANASFDTIPLSPYFINIGSYIASNASTGFLDGQIDEVRIWKKAKTQEEIQAGMFSCADASDEDLVLYYNFEVVQNESLFDIVDSTSGTFQGLDVDSIFVPGIDLICKTEPTCDMTMGQAIGISVTEIDTATTVSSGNTITVAEAGAAYRWLDCNNSYAVIDGETGQAFTPGANGSYAAEVTLNGCVDTTACVQVISTGISALHGVGLQVYPSPATTRLTVSTNSPVQHVTVFDMFGAEVLRENKEEFSIEHLPQGSYLIQVQTLDGTTFGRFVKQ